MLKQAKFSSEQAMELILAGISSGKLSFLHFEKLKASDMGIDGLERRVSKAAQSDALYLYHLYYALTEGLSESQVEVISSNLDSQSHK